MTRRQVVIGGLVRDWFSRGSVVRMKVGQYLALRRDWLPGWLCDELSLVQGEAQTFDGAEAIVAAELGRPIGDVFSAFGPALAAASTGQVHKATLRVSGRTVAVKVQRPGLANGARRGMRALFSLTLPFRFPLLRLHVGEALQQVRQMLAEEADYRYEAGHQRTMRKQLRGHKGIRVPRVYGSLCTARVLVTEWAEGPTLAKVAGGRAPAPANFDGERMAKRMGLSWFRQMFEGSRVHCDPNQANFILRTRSRAWLIDFGSVSAPDAELMTRFREFLLALAARNYSRAAGHFATMCRRTAGMRYGPLVAELVAVLEAWTIRTSSRDLPYWERSMNSLTSAMVRVVRRQGGTLQWSWLRLQRALSLLDAAFATVAPRLDYPKLLREYAEAVGDRTPWPTLRDLKLALVRLGHILERGDEYVRLDSQLLRVDALLKEI